MRSPRALLPLLLLLAATPIAVVSCGDDDLPPASSSGGTTTPQDGGGSNADGGANNGDGALPNGEGGVAPIFDAAVIPCTDDKPLMVDGGAAPSDCASSPTCSAYCTSIKDHYKLGTAQAAIACIKKLASCSSVGPVRNCVDLAMGNACKDTTSTSYCTPLVTSCDPNAGQMGSNIDQQGCETFANALSAGGRSAFSTCIQSKVTAGTCPTEIIACSNQIRQ